LTIVYTDWYNGIKVRRKTLNNRQKILDCSLNLFCRKGYESVAVSEICKEAGITKPTLYHYFKSKYGLLEALLEEKYNEYGVELERVSYSDEHIENVLHRMARIYMEYASAHVNVYLLFLALEYAPKESDAYKAIKPYVTKTFDSVVRVFDKAGNTLGNMYGRQFLFATSFIGAMNTYILMRYKYSDNKESFYLDQSEVYNVLHQFLHGVYS